MFGVLRTILAIMVMVGHLTDKWQIGTYAVFAFYIISGYLMTLIMHESYGYSWQGRKRFVLNRFLRLYPMYWSVAALSALIVWFIGNEATLRFNEVMRLPESATELSMIASMLYIGWFPNEVEPNLVPTTWAITVELFFYGLICLGLSRNAKIVGVWMALSLFYTIYCQATEMGWKFRYFPVMAASLPFSVGAMLYHMKKNGYIPLDDSVIFKPVALTILLIINSSATLYVGEYFQTGFYVSLFLSIILCYQIATGADWGALSESLDKRIGDYSYPIYLLHWPIGLLVSFLLFGEPLHDASVQGLISLVISILLVVIISALLLRYIDQPIQVIRLKLKNHDKYFAKK